MDSPSTPFRNDIFFQSLDFGNEHVTSIHAEEAERLLRALHERWNPAAMVQGQTAQPVMLRSPQAGYGKSHLLGFLKEDLSLSVLFVEEGLSPNSPPSWENLINSSLNGLHEQQRSKGGHSGIDEFARLLFARLVRTLIEQGKIPTADREVTLQALQTEPLDVLNFERSEHAVSSWFISNFNQLLDLLATPLVATGILENSSAREWLHCLFYYTQRIAGEGSAEQRASALGQLLVAEGNPDLALARWREFGSLATLVKPVIVVFDHLDHLYAQPEASSAFADLIANICGHQRGIVPIISINSDLWESAFTNRLPSALLDRISGTCVDLSGIPADSAKELIEQRLITAEVSPSHQENFLEFTDIPNIYQREAKDALSPRAILRYAKERWEEFESGETIQLDNPSQLSPYLEYETGEHSTDPPASPFSAAEHATDESSEDDEESLAGGLMSQFSSAAGNKAEYSEEDEEDEEAANNEPPASTFVSAAREKSPQKDPPSTKLKSGEGSEDAQFSPLDDTPFLRLQNMIADLRADRDEDSDGIDPPPPAEAAAPPPSKVGKSKAASSSSTKAPTEGQQKDSEGVSVGVPPLIQPTGKVDSELLDRLTLRTEHHLGAPEGPALWTRRLTTLASAGAEAFPIIRYSEFNLPEANGRQVCKWAFENSEVLFGSEPLSEARYWDPLVGFAQRRASLRAELLGTPSAEATQPDFVKLIVFVGEQEQNDLPKWLKRALNSEPNIVDLFVLDHPQQAQLAAACDLIEAPTKRSESGTILAGIADELGWFWSRVTSP